MLRKHPFSAWLIVVIFLLSGVCLAADYQLTCDILSQTGGNGNSANYDLVLSCGGQATPVGTMESPGYSVGSGYVSVSAVLVGDANGDDVINIGDAVYIINYVFRGGPAPIPIEAADVNCDGKINVGDAVYLVNYIFRGGPAPHCS